MKSVKTSDTQEKRFELQTDAEPEWQHDCPHWMIENTRGLLIRWLYKENNKLRDWKKFIYSTYSPLSSTHLWLRCSNFFNPPKKNSFVCAANRKIGNREILLSTTTNIPHHLVFWRFCKHFSKEISVTWHQMLQISLPPRELYLVITLCAPFKSAGDQVVYLTSVNSHCNHIAISLSNIFLVITKLIILTVD
jgi:hypothetical protein